MIDVREFRRFANESVVTLHHGNVTAAVWCQNKDRRWSWVVNAGDPHTVPLHETGFAEFFKPTPRDPTVLIGG